MKGRVINTVVTQKFAVFFGENTLNIWSLTFPLEFKQQSFLLSRLMLAVYSANSQTAWLDSQYDVQIMRSRQHQLQHLQLCTQKQHSVSRLVLLASDTHIKSAGKHN